MVTSRRRSASRVFSLVTLLTLGAAGGACSDGEATGSTCPQGSTLTYESFGQSFVKTNCSQCHSSSGRRQQPLFDTVEQIRSNAAAIDRMAAAGPKASNDEMPDEGTVPHAERLKLGEWLACGAP